MTNYFKLHDSNENNLCFSFNILANKSCSHAYNPIERLSCDVKGNAHTPHPSLPLPFTPLPSTTFSFSPTPCPPSPFLQCLLNLVVSPPSLSSVAVCFFLFDFLVLALWRHCCLNMMMVVCLEAVVMLQPTTRRRKERIVV